MTNGLPSKTHASIGPTEMELFEENLRNMGVLHKRIFLKQGELGGALYEHGFHVGTQSCIAICVGSLDFVFSQSAAFYFGDHGYGPAGVLLLQRDNETGHCTPRTFYSPLVNVAIDKECIGLEALKCSYPNAGWPA